VRSTVVAAVLAAAATLAAAAAGRWHASGWLTVSPAQASGPTCGDGTVDPSTEDCDPPGGASCPATTTGGPALPCNASCSCLHDFQCYEIRPPGTFERSGLTLVDTFGTSDGVSTRKVKTVCAPADKNGGDPSAPADPRHLVGYDLRAAPVARVRAVPVTDQFGALVVDVVRPARLLVPSAKSLSGPPPALASASLDHFQCYKIRRTAGSPRFASRQVTITTQLETATAVTVRKPLRLCAPADKNGESPGAETHPDHLMCYRTRSAGGPPPTQVFIHNQFGPQTYLLGNTRRELCVAARVGSAPSTTTSTSTSTTTSTSLVPGHFTTYLAPGSSAAGAFVSLTDQFGTSQHTIGSPLVLWVPANKNDEGIPDPVTHEVCYPINGPPANVAVTVENQFGTRQIIVREPFTLCVPSEKEPLAPTPVPLPRNHFKCYVADGSPIGAFVNLEDQLLSAPATVEEPSFFCNPVDKNGEGIIDPEDHVSCYGLQDFVNVSGTRRIRNQFQETTLTLYLRAELCVPSRKLAVGPIPTTTTTTTVSTTSTTIVLNFAACCDVPALSPIGNSSQVCFDVATIPDGVTDCITLGGFPQAFQVCDPQEQACVPEGPVPPSDYCCECATPVQICFEGTTGSESQCQAPCVLVPGVPCGPLSGTCGGSPSGAFLDLGGATP